MPHKREVNGVQCCLVPTIFKILHFCFNALNISTSLKTTDYSKEIFPTSSCKGKNVNTGKKTALVKASLCKEEKKRLKGDSNPKQFVTEDTTEVKMDNTQSALLSYCLLQDVLSFRLCHSALCECMHVWVWERGNGPMTVLLGSAPISPCWALRVPTLHKYHSI